MTSGEVIKLARKHAGLTQAELGKKIGVSGSMIGQWENNLRNPKTETIARLGAVLGDSFLELFDEGSGDHLPWDFMLKWSGWSDERVAQAEEFKMRSEKEFAKDAEIFANSRIGHGIILAFSVLNDDGKEAALARVSELVYIPYYTNTEEDDE